MIWSAQIKEADGAAHEKKADGLYEDHSEKRRFERERMGGGKDVRLRPIYWSNPRNSFTREKGSHRTP